MDRNGDCKTDYLSVDITDSLTCSSLGLELTGSPQVLLLDEVTSGLDSAAALSVMSAVKRLCQLYQMRIVLTIHQPASQLMELFDKILFLSKGRVAHFGTTSDLPGWLSSIG